MIVLDTNVVSEVLRPSPDEVAVAWLRDLPHAQRFVTAISVGELLQGVFFLPLGSRRERLGDALDAVLATMRGKVLDVDARCAPYYAQIRATRRERGRPIAASDAWIAAVCRRYDVPLATRNVKDFEGTGIALVNPWAG